MQRYHDTSIDPLATRSPLLAAASAELAQKTQEFLDSGGRIKQIGYQISDAPVTFVINPERSPVYAHLFEPHPAEIAPVAVGESRDAEVKQAALVLASAVLGNSPKWIAKQLHMTEKHVRQLARDYRISFRAQR